MSTDLYRATGFSLLPATHASKIGASFSTASLGTTVNGLRASRTLLITLCVYIVLCIPAIFVAEDLGLRQGPLHASQLLAVIACIPSAAAYLWLSRGIPLRGLRLIAVAAVTLAVLWLAFLAYFVVTADFGAD